MTVTARVRSSELRQTGTVTKNRARRRRIDAWKAFLYVVPALAFSLTFLIVPTFQTAWYSFYNWNGLSAATWAGVQNYVNIVQDEKLRDSFLHVGVLVVFYSFIPIVIALLLTMVISRAHALRGMSFYRTVLFLPQVIASVVVATTWLSIYSPNGLLNTALRGVGLDSLTKVWLGDFSTALVSVGFVGTWLNVGLCLVLFLSGVGNVQPELFEAARLDGASSLQEFFGITLPALRGQITVALTLTVVSSLKTFDLVYITTRGGPGDATTVPAYEAYNRAFNSGQVGSAASVAVVLTIGILIITALIGRLQPKETE
ncbi:MULTISPECIES: carbohydrate ABC transporter permease [Subtercola]|uniref:Sugar ABC transporter permease n=1 Tax=Subtercola vilae TaxID=2056433 RepID=A0A4T2C9R9_9MICO|nr:MULTISPECIES: sugar ABC transporter permease [Subtercola]MEA9983969.1 sugar ABC transporter permease [Subtercola sp. RTI3]TIH40960.1 sugar ABC transporter permease [Subtercola vilae]